MTPAAQPDELWLRAALDDSALAALDRLAVPGGPGARIGWTDPLTAAALAPVTSLIADHALPGAQLTRVIWFAKDDAANWGVPWHQDRVIAVAERHEVPGFTNWSLKSGVWHCEPPATILQAMRFVRLHLDDCDADNGAMEIALGSHRAGPVPMADAARIAETYPVQTCTARRGDVQILPMLTLHRSRPSRSTAPRRALRLDFATADLPAPLTWITR